MARNESSCLGCFVASDSHAVVRCARQSLLSPTLTEGEASHLAVAPSSLSGSASLDKIFLDWWLLARSRVLVLFRFELLREPRNKTENPMSDPRHWTTDEMPRGQGYASSFVTTAASFRDATSRHGRTITLHPRTAINSSGALRRYCSLT